MFKRLLSEYQSRSVLLGKLIIERKVLRSLGKQKEVGELDGQIETCQRRIAMLGTELLKHVK